MHLSMQIMEVYYKIAMAGINNDQTNKQNKTKPEKQLLHQWMFCCMLCYVSGTCVEKPENYYIKKFKIWIITSSNSTF